MIETIGGFHGGGHQIEPIFDLQYLLGEVFHVVVDLIRRRIFPPHNANNSPSLMAWQRKHAAIAFFRVGTVLELWGKIGKIFAGHSSPCDLFFAVSPQDFEIKISRFFLDFSLRPVNYIRRLAEVDPQQAAVVQSVHGNFATTAQADNSV